MANRIANKKISKQELLPLLEHLIQENPECWIKWMKLYGGLSESLVPKKDDFAETFLEAIRLIKQIIASVPPEEHPVSVIVVDPGLKNCNLICIQGRYYPGQEAELEKQQQSKKKKTKIVTNLRIQLNVLDWRNFDLRPDPTRNCKEPTKAEYSEMVSHKITEFYDDILLPLQTPIHKVGVEAQHHTTFNETVRHVASNMLAVLDATIKPLLGCKNISPNSKAKQDLIQFIHPRYKAFEPRLIINKYLVSHRGRKRQKCNNDDKNDVIDAAATAKPPTKRRRGNKPTSKPKLILLEDDEDDDILQKQFTTTYDISGQISAVQCNFIVDLTKPIDKHTLYLLEQSRRIQ